MLEYLLQLFRLDPSLYPTPYLSFMAPLHASAALLAGFILCPLAIFARKGSRFHKTAGYLLQIDVAIIVATAFLLLVQRQVDDTVVNASVFPNREHDRLYLALLAVVFSYYCLSGLRVWYRLPANPKDVVTSNWIDWTLAIVGFAASLIYIGTSLYALGDHVPLVWVYMHAGVLLLAFTLFDFYTFFRPPSPSRFPWWLVHMAKMILIWIILLRFIILRVFEPAPSEFAAHQAIALFLYLVICVLSARHFQRKFSAARQGSPDGSRIRQQ